MAMALPVVERYNTWEGKDQSITVGNCTAAFKKDPENLMPLRIKAAEEERNAKDNFQTDPQIDSDNKADFADAWAVRKHLKMKLSNTK